MGKADKHILALQKTPSHVTAGGLSGGKCIAKHSPPYKENCSCSHRWQAFKQALKAENASRYNVPEEHVSSQGNGRWSLLFRGGAKAVARLAKRGETAALSSENKGMYQHEVQKPQQGDWDISESKYNFKYDCNKPYYHEAHHVVPDATLRTVMVKVFPKPELAVLVATEMLDAPYNVHHMDNMIILPMDERVGDLLQLPIHRETRQCNHTAYDLYIEQKVEKRMRAALRDIVKKHREEGGEPKYKDLAAAVEAISKQTYVEVANARRTHQAKSLEELGAKLLPSSPQGAR
ncbi:AHH domain-containing protein [Myxococcus sp. CA040A]|uniref:AHH domain-containing protein n=1 Tax=Myxococcus sp. CA040A TaxID=2741738 RepID=UPI00157B06B4|nr:AHH domain-containing protein [Myxococcus sp. CA040A]NTX02423.1 AHH domain-containing protein [Myxococcus sp. CA040A]